MTSVALGLVLGALLGLRFTVFSLVPVHAIVVVVGVLSLLAGASPGAVGMAFVLWSAACQGGYAIAALVARRPRASVGLMHPPVQRSP